MNIETHTLKTESPASAYHQLDWDNLRVFLIVARQGSASLAQETLRMNLSTITRRLYQLEGALQTKLFLRSRHGHHLTDTGQQLLSHCEKIEETLYHMNATLSQNNERIDGRVRVGSTDGFGVYFVAPQLAAFAPRYPALAIDLVAVPRIINMQKFEADLAIYVERPSEQNLVSVRFCECILQLYATPEYWANRTKPKKLADLVKPSMQGLAHLIAGYTEDLAFNAQLNFLRRLLPSYRYPLSSTSISAQTQMVLTGRAMGFLPCFIANQFPNLSQVLPNEKVPLTYWMYTYSENRKNQRVRVLWDYLRSMAEQNRDYLLGEAKEMVLV